jgi:putative transcriptional regulator
MEILRNKNLTTRFQILVEIAGNQPNVPQKDIAKKLGITSQAVSEYISKLVRDEYISSSGRYKYKVTSKGVDWLLRHLSELREYVDSVETSVNNIRVTAAIADSDLATGQNVGLFMKNGLLFATTKPNRAASGIVVSAASKGDTVGVTSIQGIIELEVGEVSIIEVPQVQRGGSKNIPSDWLKQVLANKNPIAFWGLEALASLRQAGVKPDCSFAVREAVIEAARCGLSPAVVCVDEGIPMLIKRLQEAGISYKYIKAT